ncbi:MAG TPA: hypothetical protein VL551_35015 [Actinospica sp.]|nr:hypothetical protein [Actinospica sp.]
MIRVTSDELPDALGALIRAVDSLVVVASTLDAEVPAYSVGGLALAVASIGEHIVSRGLEVHAIAAGLRGETHEEAGLIAPELVRYVHHLISTGSAPGREVGRWS